MRLTQLIGFNPKVYKYPHNMSHHLTTVELDELTRKYRIEWLSGLCKGQGSNFELLVQQHFTDAEDDHLVRTLMLQHSGFWEPFGHMQLAERVSRTFAELKLVGADLTPIVAEARDWGSGAATLDNSMAQYRIREFIFHQILFIALHDPAFVLALEARTRAMLEPRPCSLCSRVFRVLDLPYWVYFGSDAVQDCCFACMIVESPRKADLPPLIQGFVSACGFIPSSTANPRHHPFMSRIPPERRYDALRAYARMGGVGHVVNKFGSWFVGLAKTGVLPKGVLVTTRGVRCLAQDGHICRS